MGITGLQNTFFFDYIKANELRCYGHIPQKTSNGWPGHVFEWIPPCRGGSGSMFEGHREVTSVTYYKKCSITATRVIEFFIKIAYIAAKHLTTSWYTNTYIVVPFFLHDTVQHFIQTEVCLRVSSTAIHTMLSPALWWQTNNHIISKTVCGTFQSQINKH